MNSHRLIASLCLLTSLFVTACGNGRLAKVNSVSINMNIKRPQHILYSNQASANVDSFASAGDGLLPMLVLGAIHKGVTAKPQREIETAIATKGIAIENIVPPAFTDAMAKGGLFTVVPQGGADATMNVTLMGYGIQHRGSAWRNYMLAPTVVVQAVLVGNDGHQLCKFVGTGIPVPNEWHSHEEFRDHPELLGVGWDTASRAAAKAVMNQIRKKQGK